MMQTATQNQMNNSVEVQTISTVDEMKATADIDQTDCSD